MSKAKKKAIKIKKPVVIGITAVLCLLFLCGYIIFHLINESKFYKIESRTKEVVDRNKESIKDGIKTVGWLRVQGTSIDYPIYYAPDYDYTYDMDSFVWTEADFDKFNNIVYILGHNVLNLSKQPLITSPYHTRFEQLMSFTYFDFIKENKYIQYTFKGKEYLYKIFAVSYPKTSEIDSKNVRSYSKKEIENYINTSKENSIYDFDVNVNKNDKIISLITCTRMFGSLYSFKVDARLVRRYESVENYDVKKTTKYNSIEEKMKGGSLNENV